MYVKMSKSLSPNVDLCLCASIKAEIYLSKKEGRNLSEVLGKFSEEWLILIK